MIATHFILMGFFEGGVEPPIVTDDIPQIEALQVMSRMGCV